jgi:hypothetical protein
MIKKKSHLDWLSGEEFGYYTRDLIFSIIICAIVKLSVFYVKFVIWKYVMLLYHEVYSKDKGNTFILKRYLLSVLKGRIQETDK